MCSRVAASVATSNLARFAPLAPGIGITRQRIVRVTGRRWNAFELAHASRLRPYVGAVRRARDFVGVHLDVRIACHFPGPTRFPRCHVLAACQQGSRLHWADVGQVCCCIPWRDSLEHGGNKRLFHLGLLTAVDRVNRRNVHVHCTTGSLDRCCEPMVHEVEAQEESALNHYEIRKAISSLAE
jgi:hypothetical protein